MKIRVCLPAMAGNGALWLGNALVVGGAAAIAVFVWSESDRWLYQRVQDAQLEVAEETPVAAPIDAPVVREPRQFRWRPTIARDPLVMGRLEIPRLGLQVVVREGVDRVTLRRAAGHVPATARPGTTGNAVIAGHRDGLFRPLREIESGDIIRFRDSEGVFTYAVDDVSVVQPDAVEVMEASEDARLTLVTCFPFEYVGPAPRRFVVSAVRVDVQY